ncbi:hypothetical protein AVEN_95326-1 [Araneus ventricosus]|uniref:Uncharacterized protein n=1 Tax=Araneus ventricosus TaxID=182803 RepID=A0A4Y2A141_ARAVE|nr:hypothetical protein AVEN_95326-1 [Araneus ventricosus]
MSTSRPYLYRKSAPRIGRETSATIKFQLNKQPKPQTRHLFLIPNVLIEEPFAATSFNVERLHLSERLAGKTETEAPLSIQYRIPDLES